MRPLLILKYHDSIYRAQGSAGGRPRPLEICSLQSSPKCATIGYYIGFSGHTIRYHPVPARLLAFSGRVSRPASGCPSGSELYNHS